MAPAFRHLNESQSLCENGGLGWACEGLPRSNGSLFFPVQEHEGGEKPMSGVCVCVCVCVCVEATEREREREASGES